MCVIEMYFVPPNHHPTENITLYTLLKLIHHKQIPFPIKLILSKIASTS